MNISVIGGDSRIVELVKLLVDDGNNVCLYGLDKSEELQKFSKMDDICDCFDNTKRLRNIVHIDNIHNCLKNADLVITSIPLSKDGESINATYADQKILVKDFFSIVKNKKIITGNLTDGIKKIIKSENNNEIIDVLQLEELTVLNAIPTAEGAIQIAMEKSDITLHNSKCLVLGFGRIGKILCKMLAGIGAKVYCEARKQHDIAWLQAYGYNAIHLKDLNNYLGKFDFIFNTIPYLILDKVNLNLVKKDCVLIDLASKPGGIDFEEADRLNLKNEWALALPGKVAAKTSASYIYEIIKKI